MAMEGSDDSDTIDAQFAFLCNSGVAAAGSHRYEEALSCFERARVLKPGSAEALRNVLAAHYNLGIRHSLEGRQAEAAVHFERALALHPGHPEILNNLFVATYGHGLALIGENRYAEALPYFERALALRSDQPEILNNLGLALQNNGRLDEAAERYRLALALWPDFADARMNLGTVFQERGLQQEAIHHYERVLRFKPDFADIHMNISNARLLMGDFAAGWRAYEWRWRTAQFESRARRYDQPVWDGGPLSSGRLLVWGEQGIGDEVMFAGLIPELVRRGLGVVLECDYRLAPMFSRSFPGVEVCARRPALGPARLRELGVAAHIPCASLPLHLRGSLDAFRNTVSPYLFADDAIRTRFRSRYRDRPRVIGLAWHTKNSTVGHSRRSIALPLLAPLLAIPGIRWVNLQYGAFDDLAAQAAAAGVELLIDREVDQMTDIEGFAGQIAALDLVVTIDNSTAHVAAALGVPTWLLLPFAPDRRWLMGREDSPWYPTLRLFRQPEPGNWAAVVRRVAAELC